MTKKSAAAISRRPLRPLRRRPPRRAPRGRAGARRRRRRARSSRRPCRGSASRNGRRTAAPRGASGCTRVVSLERRLPRRGADAQRAVRASIASSPARFRSTSTRRADEAHVERGDEALAAGDRLRVLAALRERRERLLERAARRRTRRRRASRPGSTVVQQLPDAWRGERQLDVVAAERVGDRVRDRGGRATSCCPRRSPSRRAP